MGGTGHTIRGTEGGDTAPLILNLDARWGWMNNTTPLPFYPWQRDPQLILQEAGWARRPV